MKNFQAQNELNYLQIQRYHLFFLPLQLFYFLKFSKQLFLTTYFFFIKPFFFVCNFFLFDKQNNHFCLFRHLELLSFLKFHKLLLFLLCLTLMCSPILIFKFDKNSFFFTCYLFFFGLISDIICFFPYNFCLFF